MWKATGCKQRRRKKGRRKRMKVAVSSTGKTLDSAIDPGSAGAAYFLIVETDDMSFEVSNESISLGGGAGIQSAQFIASKGAEAVITGNCGPNAMRTLSAAGVKVIIGQTGTVREAVERFKRGELRSSFRAPMWKPTTDGRGMGGTGVMGMEAVRHGPRHGPWHGGVGGYGPRDADPSSPDSPTHPVPALASKDEEIRLSKNEAQDLMGEMQEIQSASALERGG
jgi:predicted Fe-Mo cluster-binding NifX family protein